MPQTRHHKQAIKKLLAQPDQEAARAEIFQMPAKAAASALLSAIRSPDPTYRGRAVAVLGLLTAKMARENPEHGREVMRRLAWSLNEESGSIGWGSAEAMGEIMALDERLAGEFANILASYVRDGVNQLEFVPLLQGALQGLLRLAQARPELARGLDVADSLPGLRQNGDPAIIDLVERLQEVLKA